MNNLNPELHTCPDCGYQWKHGQHGGHSCVDRLVKEIAKLKSERDELIKALDSVADELGIVWMRKEFELANEVLRRIKGGAA